MPQDTEDTLIEDQLVALEAEIQSLEIGTNSALERLAGRSDPDSLQQRISLLLEVGRAEDAASLLRGREPHKRWCVVGVSALVRAGLLEDADRLVRWAREIEDLRVSNLCAVAFAEGIFAGLRDRAPDSPHPSPISIGDAKREQLRHALLVLEPLLVVIRANQRIRNELEAYVAQLALEAAHLIGRQGEAEALGTLLAQRSPIPISFAQSVLLGQVQPSTDLSERLRAEHPDSFTAKLLSSLIESEVLRHHEEAFHSAMALVGVARTEEEQTELCKALNQIAQHLDETSLKEVDRIAPSLLREDDSFRTFLQADRLLRRGDWERAARILDDLAKPDDPSWLQLRAQAHLEEGDFRAAAELMASAAGRLPNASLLERAASIAFQAERLELAADLLERATLLNRRDSGLLRNLAMIYIRLEKHPEAARTFKTLSELEPSDLSYKLGLAKSLALAGDAEGSLQVYNDVCSSESVDWRLIAERAQLLMTLGRREEAFDSLNVHREGLWEIAEFVMFYAGVAFGSEHEDEGAAAIARVRELQAQGKAPRELVQEKSIPEVDEQLKEFRETRKAMLEMVRLCRAPWLLVDDALGNAAYWAWALRTQELRWLGDGLEERAALCIYATNSFATVSDGKGSQQIVRVGPPKDGGAVVADLSALITLHQLDLLDAAATYFGQVFVPASYLARALDEQGRLRVHQPSKRTEAESILSLLEARKIAVSDSEDAEFPLLDEHGPEDQVAYRLRDLLLALDQAGLLSGAERKRLRAVAQRESAEGSNSPELIAGQTLVIAASTLGTLAHVNLLEGVCSAFAVRVSPEDVAEMRAAVRGLNAQERAAEMHSELWVRIRTDPRFVPVPVPDADESARGELAKLAIDGTALAKHVEVPLMADDRVCQAVMFSERQQLDSSFGTDQLVQALADVGSLEPDAAVQAILTLVRWRYRFLLVPPSLLMVMAMRFSPHLPGRELAEVARYVHDCMGDPGLLGGMEPTTPPTSMAAWLYQTWVDIVAEFLMDAWMNESLGEEEALLLMEWGVSEFLPSPPSILGGGARDLSEFLEKTMISRALLRVWTLPDVDRARGGLRALSGCLGISTERFVDLFSEFIDELG